MKDAEEAIDKVLAGLRNTSAPSGMNGRIMEGIEARASVRSGWSWDLWSGTSVHSGVTGLMKWSAGLACVCAVAFVVTTNRCFRSVNSPLKRASGSAATVEVVTKSSQVIRSRSDVRRMKAVNPDRRANVWNKKMADGSDLLAVEEMRAASHPPPPRPLTDQEKLLLRVVRKGDPVEVAALNPMVRAARYEEEKAEVQKFFKSERPGDSE